MITVNGKQLRNLEEQVQANKNDIARIIEGEELLARLGIKVVGQVEAESELPNPVTYDGEFGDAFLVGDDTPYDYYIYTRPFEGETDPQWFNLGPFPVAGPQGPAGERGPAGEPGVRGSQWFSGTGQPTTTSGYNVGDYYINVGTGNIWHLHDVDGIAKWLLEGNIKGPQGAVGPAGPRGIQGEPGPQGPEGPQGPVGPMVEIIGSVGSVSELEAVDITTYPRNAAYIQTNNKHVWIIMGGDGEPLYWYDAGVLNAGTVVTVNGITQTTWNADTKLTTGASLDYSLGGGLKVYQMSGGSRTSNYGGIRQDGVLEARAGTNNSAQLAAGALTITTPTGGSTRFTPKQILSKAPGASNWTTLNIPAGKTGTLALTTDISSQISAWSNSLQNQIFEKKLMGKSDYKAAGQRDSILLRTPVATRIMILRANDNNKKWTFRYESRDGEIIEEKAQLMIAFIPNTSYSSSSGRSVYRPWIIKIDQGTIIPSVEAHTYDARTYDYYLTTDMAVYVIGEFIPPSDCATDVFELYQGSD